MNISDIKVNHSWDEFLNISMQFNSMLNFINNEKDICPIREKVFRFFENDLDNIKCIILGMDPYPATYIYNDVKLPVATGRSFEVANVNLWTDKYKQVSLANIFKSLWYLKYDEILSMSEIREKIVGSDFKYINIHDWFDAMEKEGVLFLNATLTTKAGKSNAHSKIWDDFMNELFSYIVNKNKRIKWLIWGENAKDRVHKFVDDEKIVYSCHPATRVKNTFIIDCCFKNVKEVNWV